MKRQIDIGTKFFQDIRLNIHKAFLQQWAAIQYNLALAYSDRIQGEPTENIQAAIAFCEQALRVFNSTAFPNDCRQTAGRLGDLLNPSITIR